MPAAYSFHTDPNGTVETKSIQEFYGGSYVWRVVGERYNEEKNEIEKILVVYLVSADNEMWDKTYILVVETGGITWRST